MRKIQLTPTREVSSFGVPYVIAELGSNHNGDMKLAGRLIRAAKEAGADCVKFQSWSKDSIFSRKVYDDNYFLADDYRQRKDYTLEEIVEEFSISGQELMQMRDLCREVGIDFASTPFSPPEVDFLVDELEAPFIKVASMDLNNYPFLDYLARKGRPVVLSTGLSQLSEIDRAVRVIEEAGNDQLVILHCVSIYPPDDTQVNLRNITTLQELYPHPVGFSDHTLGVTVPLASVALGACVIEKHFTLDKAMFGWDHKISASPEELAAICREGQRVQKVLGRRRIVSLEPPDRKAAFRRSIVTTRAIKAGEVIAAGDIDYKRPGDGIPPEHTEWVVGRTAKRDLEDDKPIRREDLV